MTNKTINPLNMTEASADTVVAGAHSLDRTEICPRCQAPMKKLNVSRASAPIPAWVCIADRVCLPIAD